ncbi:hypothetical protein [Staphylococcus petrasii]|uniref:hypothetical protein n=1 Tax=Staphylococcus petrasii TaxID=1276936 RepID=UPI003F661280
MAEVKIGNLNFKQINAVKILEKELKRDPFLLINFNELVNDLISERDSFRKQRDELINDMAEVKRKAEAFDEIKVNLYHVKDLKSWETLDPKDHEFLRDIFNEIPSDWEVDH